MHIFFKGIKLNYQVTGHGKPLLFLHGWGGEINSFSPVIEELSKKRTCIALDFIGFGKSGYPNTPMTVKDYKDSVVFLLDNLYLRKVDVIAHSFGGRVAFKLMSENPDYVNSAILIAPAGIKPKRTFKVTLSIILYKIKKVLNKIGLISAKFKRSGGSEDYKVLNPTMKKTFINVVNEDLTKDIKRITLPTLIIYGVNDTAVPLYMIKKIKKLITTSDYISLFGGHFCYLKDFYRFVKIAQNFLDNFE